MATILIVDDRAINREFLTALLECTGHRLLEAQDGNEALALVRAEHPDLVISDIVMPRMDGYELARQLRADPATAATQVIFYSANYEEQAAQTLARASGVVHFLRKPADTEVIRRTVDSALKNAKAPPAALSSAEGKELERQHLHLLTDKLAQKVGELEGEIAERKKAQEELRQANEELEARVAKRTAELREANAHLGAELTERKRIAAERDKLIHDLQDALASIKTLSGLVPICATCKKIRDDEGYWSQVETYVEDHSAATFTHGICPECAEKFRASIGKENKSALLNPP